MTSKNIKIRFYVGYVGLNGGDGLVSEVLSRLSAQTSFPCLNYGDAHYQIRGLRKFHNGSSFQGVFAKLRNTDMPHIGDPEGGEREIDMEKNEGVIEKNYFLYYKKHELLVYQSNLHGSTIDAFGKYFSNLVNHATIFSPIIKPDSISRLMKEGREPTRIEVKIAKPTNPDFYPSDDWTDRTLSLMNEMGGSTVNLTISAGGRGKSRQWLMPSVKDFLYKAVASGHAKVAKISLSGLEHPIDLLADRILVIRSVKMNGRYPLETDIYSALLAARDEVSKDLDIYFGSIDGS